MKQAETTMTAVTACPSGRRNLRLPVGIAVAAVEQGGDGHAIEQDLGQNFVRLYRFRQTVRLDDDSVGLPYGHAGGIAPVWA